MSDLAAPLTPPDCDLRDFPFMPLMVARLRRSKAWLMAKRRPEIGFYMINLWTAAWHDFPAASIEDDDDVMADLAMCDIGKWKKVRDAVLHGWVKCSDGRLYHPTVAEQANASWATRQSYRERLDRARAAKAQKASHANNTPVITSIIEPIVEPTTGLKGQGQGQGEDSDLRSDAGALPMLELPILDAPKPKAKPKADPNDPKTILWNEGRAVVGRLTVGSDDTPGSLVGKFVKDAKAADGSVDYALVLDVVREAEKQRPDQPIPWIRAAIKARVSPGAGRSSSRPNPDDPGGVHEWCAANGAEPTTSPNDMKRAKWLVGGMLFDKDAVDILLATGMAFDRHVDWNFLRDWGAAGIDGEAIYQTIKRMVEGFRARGDYNPPGSLKFFDNAVRAAAGRTAA